MTDSVKEAILKDRMEMIEPLQHVLGLREEAQEKLMLVKEDGSASKEEKELLEAEARYYENALEIIIGSIEKHE